MNNIAIMDRHIINHPDIIRVWFIIVIFLADWSLTQDSDQCYNATDKEWAIQNCTKL